MFPVENSERPQCKENAEANVTATHIAQAFSGLWWFPIHAVSRTNVAAKQKWG
jgi:hypothetical protein